MEKHSKADTKEIAEEIFKLFDVNVNECINKQDFLITVIVT